MPDPKNYLRFTGAQRIEHWVMFASFTLLGITGVPQKFAGDRWAETMIALMGGIEQVRLLHHWSAAIMALGSIYHVIVLAYKVYVQRVRWTMFPRFDDVIDALDVIRFNLGLTKEHPKFDRYNFGEKFEYWAFVWGAVVMGLTGFMMWNPINAARFMPGDLIPAAKAAHGGEALLAILAILVWHFYNVHFKMFNKAMFNGALSEREMEEEHGLELERIKQGKADPKPAPDLIKQRERAFIPVAAIFSVVMIGAFYLFVGYEETAITTVPRNAAQVPAYVPVTPTPTPRAPAASGTTASVSALKPLPADHAGRPTCIACHLALPKPKLPDDHKSRGDTTCSACHKVGTAPAPGGATPAAKPGTAPASGGIKPLPASHAGRTVCNVCHETGVSGPKNPADHTGRAETTCVACHKMP